MTAFDSADLQCLLDLYHAAANATDPRRPPWTWSALTRSERSALARLVDVFVATYNHVHAVKTTDLVPRCWRQHPALAAELGVQVWLWYHAHIDPEASPATAGDYYHRHLPGFQARIDHTLGISPAECRRLEHPRSWRAETDDLLARYTDSLDPAATPDVDVDVVDLLGQLNYGFSHLNDAGER